MLSLYIGNKNYSSWSLRAWLLMRQLDIAFEERKFIFHTEQFRSEIGKVSPVGRVPVLIDDGFAVWDSLAIAEYLAERTPGKRVWPADPKARARARSVCAEMHSGFSALRNHLPMNIEASLPGLPWNLQTRQDIERIIAMWTELRTARQGGGAFLFGDFCAADAFFAPVVSRFVTYAVGVPPACAAYIGAVCELPAMQAWTAEALAEKSFVAEDEPYRNNR
jgi:glutathione S-transferase